MGMYDSLRTGRGNPVPTTNGQVNINALLSGMVSRDPWKYYSSLKLAPGTTLAPQYQLFNAAVGQPDPNPLVGGPATQTLTKVETNMPQACTNGFSAPRDLIMDVLGFYFQQGGVGVDDSAVGTFANISDMIAFCQYTYFEFKIIDKIFYEGKLEMKPGGMGFYGVSTQTNQQVYTLGISNIHAADRVGQDFTKYLAPLLTWSLTIYAPSNSGPGGVAAQLLAQGSADTTEGNGLWLVAYIGGLTDRAIS